MTIETLRRLPHAKTIEIIPAKGEPKRQIIHLLNRSFVDQATFVSKLYENSETTLSSTDVKHAWSVYVSRLETLQEQQAQVLFALLRFNELGGPVYIDGLSAMEVSQHRANAQSFEKWDEIGDDAMNPSDRDRNQLEYLKLGASIRVPGMIVRVTENRTDQVTRNVNWNLNPNSDFNERESAIVQNILAAKATVVVLIMDGNHDLSDNIPDGVELVRATVTGYGEFEGTE